MWIDAIGRLFPEGTRITGRPEPAPIMTMTTYEKSQTIKEFKELEALEDAGVIYKDDYVRNIIAGSRKSAARWKKRQEGKNE